MTVENTETEAKAKRGLRLRYELHQQREAEKARRDAEYQTGLEKRDAFLGHPWEKRKVEEQARRDRREKKRVEFREQEAERVKASNAEQRRVNEGSRGHLERVREWKKFMGAWTAEIEKAEKAVYRAIIAEDLEAAAAARLRLDSLARLRGTIEKADREVKDPSSQTLTARAGVPFGITLPRIRIGT